MTDPKPIIPSWGYHASEEPKIFDLTEGEKLPSGWHNTPDRAQWPAEKSPTPVSPHKGSPAEPKPFPPDGKFTTDGAKLPAAKAKFTAIEGDKTK